MSPSRSLVPRLAVAALTAGTLLLSSCTGTTEPESREPYRAPHTPAPVPDPTSKDAVTTAAVEAEPLATAERPNLLMITADDAALKDMEFMPHLQELMADQGLTLENGMAPTPICVPARASLLTGQYAHNHGAVTIDGEGGGFEAFDDEDTLPVWLSEAGYDTLFLGKYLNGYGEAQADHEPPGWSTWRPTLDPTTYNFENPTLLVDGEAVETETYSTTLLSDQTQELLRDPERTQTPWYMWVNYVAPHHGGPPDDDDPADIGTTRPEERDRDTFADLELPTTPEMFEKDSSDKALVKTAREQIPEGMRAQMREARQQRVESLQSVDRAIARTIETLRETGQLDDTYVVFTSDNGYALGEHNIEGKLWYFRDLVGVPMYVRGPGIPAGEVSSAPVSNADWAPTFAALAGAEPTRDVDGADVMPWLLSGATRRVVPIEAYPVHGGLTPLYTGVVVGPWTYVRGRKGREEVYYREVDPGQLSSLRHDPRWEAQLKELRRIAKRYADCSGSSCQSDFWA